MEFLSVAMLSFVGCFIALIITLVFFNFIILMSKEDKPKTKVLNKQRKSFGLSKERVERISLKTEQAYLDKYSVLGVKCDHIIVDDSWCQREVNETQEKYLETLPHHKTRVKNRSKRQRKK